ncbi:MAG: PAS domain-containing protein [Sulfurimonas sp.]|uniref:PAS domain-containing hybrid sensor histidine kinase/response regulator n=1 Tax=Sulfurimonas sp. TaxID=2022749 RepID=UPI0025D99A48|nr:PAS domain-containing protein [Sulfurimonas sp.]MCK9491530.1 PAS domain-containing protein [Sulfurimonas sp.]
MENKFKAMLNAQHNMVLVTKGGEKLIEANQVFFDFFGYKNIKEFMSHNSCVCEYFIEEKGYLKSNMGSLNWVEYILSNPKENHLAKIKKDKHIITFKVFAQEITEQFFGKNEVVVTFIDITQELEQEKLLIENTNLKQALLDNGAVAIFLASSQRKILEVNSRACEMFGFNKDELVGASFEIIHSSSNTFRNFSSEYKKLTDSNITNIEYEFKTKDNNLIWCEVFGRPLDKDDLNKGIIWSLIDITQRKKVQNELELERRLFSGGPVVVIEWEPSEEWPINYISQNSRSVLGFSKEEMMSEDFVFLDLIHKDDVSRVAKEVNNYISNGANVYEQSYRLKLKCGEYRWFYDFTQLIRDANNEVVAIRGYIFDQTQLKETKQLLYNEKQRLENIIEGTNVGTWEYNIQTAELDINERWASMIGYGISELSPVNIDTWYKLTHPDDLIESKKKLKDCFDKKSDFYESKCRMKHKDGRWVWILTRAKVTEWDGDNRALRMAGTHSYIDDEEKLKQEVLQHKEMLQELFDNMKSGVAIYEAYNDGEDFIFKDINKASLIMDNIKKEDVIGKRVTEVFPMVKQMGLFDIFKKVYETGLSEYHPISLYNDDNLSAYRENFVYRISTKEIVAIYNDETQRVLDKIELEKSTKKAELANEAKSQFLANMSHEIRTPMNAILGLSELMQDTVLDEKQQDLLSKINGSSKMLLGIINDILDYSKIEAGRMKIELEAFELENIFMRLRVIFSDSFEKKGLDLHFLSKDDVPSVIVSDELRISQALTNFLSNAYKFTSKGSIKVSVELKQKISPIKALLCFSVEDEGIGMSQEQLQKLFKAFVQADDSTTRKYGGTGLGLVISKKIVEAMGGRVEVDSKEGAGSKFSFEVDVEVKEWKEDFNKKDKNFKAVVFEDILKNHEKILPDLRGLKILLVEDNEVNQEVATMMLQRVGIEVFVVKNGQEALEEYKEHQGEYDLILMDMQMPIMGGEEATKLIREFDKVIPIVALTAASTIEDRQKALEADMNEHLSKPIDSHKLYSMIQEFCKDKIANNYSEIVILDRDFLQNSIGSEKLSQRLFIKFKEQLESEFKDLVMRLKSNDTEAKVAIHALKGVSGSLGAKALSQICKKIEESFDYGIKSSDIKSLETIMSKTKNELINLIEKKKEIEQSSIKSIQECKEELVKLQELLSNSSIVEDIFFTNIYIFLKDKIAQERLEELKESIEDLEHDGAMKIIDNLLEEISTL